MGLLTDQIGDVGDGQKRHRSARMQAPNVTPSDDAIRALFALLRKLAKIFCLPLMRAA